MSYATDHIATSLKNAREIKGLSQRALSELAGVPQSHISNIESGKVDLRVSSLVALARALELELTLVPRKSVPAVNSVVRSTTHTQRQPGLATRRELDRLRVHFETLEQIYPKSQELVRFQRQVRELQNLSSTDKDLEVWRHVNRLLAAVIRKKDAVALRRALEEMARLRNDAAHSADSLPMTTQVRPAYSLEENDDGE